MGYDDTFEVLGPRFVRPIYLGLMGTGAAKNGAELLPDVVALGRAADPDVVVTLLRGFWRERVAGAWLSLLNGDDAVADAVVAALRTSRGRLDAPPLATAAVLLNAPGALESMADYHEADLASAWGAAGFIAAASAHLAEAAQAHNPLPAPTVEDAEMFERVLNFGRFVLAG
jgi:hypothetical protein